MNIIQVEYRNHEKFVINERYRYSINYTTSVEFNNRSRMKIEIYLFKIFREDEIKDIYYIENFSGIIDEPSKFMKFFGFTFEDEIDRARKELISKVSDCANKLYAGEKIIEGFKKKRS